MDVPPIAGATPERLAPPAPSGMAPDTSRRLASIEAGLAELGERFDTLAAALDASVRKAVAEEFGTASAELRHTVSELGRLLVRDLGRLSKILAEHRDSIVADVRAAAPEPPPPAPGAGGASPAPAGSGEAAAAVIEDLGNEPGTSGDDSGGTGGADPDGSDTGERQRRTLLRRRQA